jgi:hypothetical protein
MEESSMSGDNLAAKPVAPALQAARRRQPLRLVVLVVGVCAAFDLASAVKMTRSRTLRCDSGRQYRGMAAKSGGAWHGIKV